MNFNCIATEDNNKNKYITLSIKINGIKSDIIKSIQSDLSIYKLTTERKVTKSRLNNLYSISEKQIISTLSALGYYTPNVISKLQEISNGKFYVEYNISTGHATKIRSINISVIPNNNNPNIIKNLQTNNLKINDIITHENYENAKNHILSNMQEQGYLNVKFKTSTLSINRKNNTADINLIVELGKLFYFGDIYFIDYPYPETLLKRYIPFGNGTPYTLENISKIQKNLYDSDLFSKVRLEPKPDFNNPENIFVPVGIRLTNKPSNRYLASIGYGTDTSLRASASWQHKRNSMPGHRFGTKLQASKIKKQAEINYLIPGKFAATDKYLFTGAIAEEEIDYKYSLKYEIAANNIKQRGKFQQVWRLQYFTELFRLTPSTPKQTKKFLLPTIKFNWSNIKDINCTPCGSKMEFRAIIGSKSLFSSTNIIQSEILLKHVYDINETSFLSIQGNFGATIANDFKNIPFSLRFFAGGDNSVRGFSYRSLGPSRLDRNGKTVVVGGKHLIVINTELEKEIMAPVNLAIFFDAGKAYNKFNSKPALGTGIGGRIKTPLGAFKADIAKPLNTVKNKHLRLHFSFSSEL